MDSVLEVQRQTHEEVERFERALATLLATPQPSHERKVRAENAAAEILNRTHARIENLNNLYNDSQQRKDELDFLANQNDLDNFYARLKRIQDHHAKYPDPGPGFDVELEALVEDPDQEYEDEEFADEDPTGLLFSGEEAYGKYLDLYANHVAYTNLKHINKRPGYLQYLDFLLAAQNGLVHQDLPLEARHTKDYETYIQNLHAYLVSFARRTQPLVDVDGQQRNALAEFIQKWEQHEVPGWEDKNASAKNNGSTEPGIWCAACQKHYSKQTVYDAHLTSKKHIKASAKQATATPPPQNPNGTPQPHQPPSSQSVAKSRMRNAAESTYLVTALLNTLLPTLNDTKSNVERKFSLTAREREQELLDKNKPAAPPPKAAGEEGAEPEEEQEEERIYNPLKLPLGWDGKPIPYWLYKLHGLGVEYRCEICSDHVYMGRKNFDRHFQESRHAFGMRALGLPNTKHFHEITRIQDALTLAEKLKQEGRHEIFEQETMEELEDDEGNVYNRKTYEDLKKQGLI